MFLRAHWASAFCSPSFVACAARALREILKLVKVPVIETPRLILRAHEPRDFAACAAMWGNAEFVRHIGGNPSTEQQTWMRILAYAGLWAFVGFGYWALEEKSSGEYIGDLGFANFHRDIKPSIEERPELGWGLRPAVHGQGYATEGLKAALAWGDGNLSAPKTVCLISPQNAPSLRVAAKLGYVEYARGFNKDIESVILARPKAI